MRKIITLLFILYSSVLFAQTNSGYMSNSFILDSRINPASMPGNTTIIGLPFLSNLNLSGQVPYSLNDVFRTRGDDSLLISIPQIIDNSHNENSLYVSMREQVFYVGTTVGVDKKTFLYMGDILVTYGGLSFGKDFLGFLLEGNGNYLNKKLNFNTEGFDFMSYNSLYFGLSHQINKHWKAGMRFNYLNGILNLHTERFNTSFYTDSNSTPTYVTDVNADILIQSSGLRLLTDGSNDFDFMELDIMGNRGFSIDMGVEYQYDDKLRFSASVTDLGSISWSEINSKHYQTNGNVAYTFSGLHYDEGENDFQNQIDELADSLKSIFDIDTLSGSYSTPLPTNIYLGGEYTISEKQTVSLLYQHSKLFRKRYGALSLGYQHQLTNSFRATANYQIINSSFDNLGLGFVWSPKKFQLYIMLDNIFAWNLQRAESLFFKMGMSFKIRKKDRPSPFTEEKKYF